MDVSARLFVSISALRFSSAARLRSASLTIFSISASLKPLDAVIVMCCARAVALSVAETFRIPLASMSKATSICGRAEHLRLLDRDRGVTLDQRRRHAAQRLDTQGQRRHVEQQHVLDFAAQHTRL